MIQTKTIYVTSKVVLEIDTEELNIRIEEGDNEEILIEEAIDYAISDGEIINECTTIAKGVKTISTELQSYKYD